jgi:uncharacterized protein (DUF488 family)
MEIYTIGFTQRSARGFFGALGEAGIRRLIDVRLKNDSQLAGFTRKRDLPFFLEHLVGAEYEHNLMLAPTDELLSSYRKRRISWSEYERSFVELIRGRHIENELDRALFRTPTVLLCSEPKPDQCHRRLVAEYLAEVWTDLKIAHL